METQLWHLAGGTEEALENLNSESRLWVQISENDVSVQRPNLHVGGPQLFSCPRVLISHIHSPGRLRRPQGLGAPRCSNRRTVHSIFYPVQNQVNKSDKRPVAKIWHPARACDIRRTQVQRSKKCRVVCKSEHLAGPSFRWKLPVETTTSSSRSAIQSTLKKDRSAATTSRLIRKHRWARGGCGDTWRQNRIPPFPPTRRWTNYHSKTPQRSISLPPSGERAHQYTVY